MRRKARDPIVAAIAIFILLFVALFLYLASAAIDRRAAERASQAPWVPPGWTSPTSPPPSSK